MHRVAFIVAVGSIAGLAVFAERGRASLYSPDEPMALNTDEGKPVALPFGEFHRRLAVLRNASNPTKINGKDNPDRQKFLDRIAKMEPMAADKKWPDIQAAALATDLLRTGQSDKVLNLLTPRTRSRTPNYFVLVTLAHVHANGGGSSREWTDALEYFETCRQLSEMPAEVKGLTKSQRDWWEKLDKDYLPQLCRIRRDETAGLTNLSAVDRKKADENEDVLPLFPLPGEDGKPRPPVRFVNDAGVYEPGKIAAAEKAKLPPEAIAIVQQLLLWLPNEIRLYWLLAELYTADNDLDSAATIFDECVGSQAHGNRKILMEHRQAVRSAIEARPPQSPEQPPIEVKQAPPTPAEKPPIDAKQPPPAEKPPISMKTVLIYFGAVALIVLIAFVRMMFKRGRLVS